MRTNNMKHFTISQHTSWNFDKKEITFEVHFSDGIRHTYDKWKYDTFAEACTAYETLEARAKELEEAQERQECAMRELEVLKFLTHAGAIVTEADDEDGIWRGNYKLIWMGEEEWSGNWKELIDTYEITMNEWKQEGLYK